MANPAPESIVEVVGASVASKGMLTGGAVGLVGFFSQVNWIGVSGVVIAVVGLVINVYFQWRKDHRESLESAARIEALRERARS
ncbi:MULTISPECIES: holin [unclassified Pseudomonas]|uniref:holin n=1 Tax=unclassified Pseudomonas TaxID=196821 RepID=UPI000C886FAF|nr:MULTISPECIES: holin [unclassified Pseudomonas]PMX29251.1 holin [Pseudomonas sp. GW460-12]PMX36892.1 holin [Pseudomonas sp. MPR-R2A4]PMX43288.1 holin [Pseudomonas sp. MPR-R2A7]PMX53311.1 holin [Pseudomonas sp. MPR-R2A6]PMX93413.1 holin [Pseudomonas sp. MPR-R2A3]